MNDPRDLIGKWAVCGGGRIGLIERKGKRHNSTCWFGTGLSGHPWESTIPHVLAPSNQIILNALPPLKEVLK